MLNIYNKIYNINRIYMLNVEYIGTSVCDCCIIQDIGCVCEYTSLPGYKINENLMLTNMINEECI